jgi:hypothetical protein
MVAPETAAEHAAPFTDAGAGAGAESWANTVGAKVETIATTAKIIAKTIVLPCAIATTYNRSSSRSSCIYEIGCDQGEVISELVVASWCGRLRIYRGFMAVGKRVGFQRKRGQVDRGTGHVEGSRKRSEL